MAAGAQLGPPPGADQQQPQDAQPPSWKKILLGMIPIAGPLLVAHGQQEYERKLQKEQQTVAGKIQPMTLANQYATNQDLDPDTRLGWQQLQGDMAIHNEENYTRPYTPDHVKRFQDLLGKTNAQIALKRQQEQSAVPSALAPPPGSASPGGGQAGIPGMLPQGAGPAQVNATPAAVQGQNPGQDQGQSLNVPPPPGAPQPDPSAGQADPMQSLLADAKSPNSIIRGRAVRQLTEMRDSMISAEQMARQGMSLIQAYKESGAEKSGIPYFQFAETIGRKVTAAPMVTGKPGETIFNPTGQPVATIPQAVTTPEGATSTMVTPTPAMAGGMSVPPPPGAASTTIATSPPKLNDEETRSINAAQIIADKYKVPFDPSKNPRNPSAQLPTNLLAEFRATAKTLNEDPELKQMRLQSAADLAAARASMEGMRTFQQNMQTERRTDASRARQQAELSKAGRPIDDSIKNWGTLNDLLTANSPMADSQIAIALVKAENAGAGSGVRITQAEINNTQGGKNQWEKLKSAVGKWNPDSGKPFEFTDAQRQQIRQMYRMATEKLSAKKRIVDDANDDLLGSDDPKDHMKVVNQAKKKMAAIDMGTGSAGSLTPPPGAPVTVKTKAERDALPAGTQYLRPGDSNVYVKQ